MREFSENEKDIIKNKLIDGSGLSRMLSHDFQSKARLLIHFNGGTHRFEYRSDSYDSRLAVEELVNLIDLLQFLEKDGLIRKYPSASTSIRDFDEIQQISLGDSNSTKVHVFLLDAGSDHIPEFVKENENYTFKATEPLKSLVLHDFKTWDERKHLDNIKQTKNANRLAIALAIVSISFTGLITYVQYLKSYEEINKRINHLESRVVLLSIQRKIDSLSGKKIDNDLFILRKKMDSLSHPFKSKRAKMKAKI